MFDLTLLLVLEIDGNIILSNYKFCLFIELSAVDSPENVGVLFLPLFQLLFTVKPLFL